jgi:probable HAF family extracellular repeat protein
MASKGWTWGVLLLSAVTSVGACDDDDGVDGGGAGAGGEGTQAGMPSVDAGGPPGGTGGSSTSGANAGGQAGGGQAGGGQSGGGAGGESGQGGEAGQSLGGSNGEDTPHSRSCPEDGGAGGRSNWYPLGGAGGAEADGEYHRIQLGSEQIAIAINDSGQILITSGWGREYFSASCQAWVVDADSVSEVTTSESGCVLAVDMNEAGTVLASQGSVPFLWKDGVATPLGGVASGTPIALNDAEQVVLRGTPVGPALWHAGILTPLRTSADQHLVPVAINEGGQVIGFSGDAEQTEQTWLWEDGSASALGLQAVHALNEVGDIAGVKDGAAGILSDGSFSPLSISTRDIRIHAMTDDGVLVGDVYEWNEEDLAQPFRFEAGVARFLETYGSARDINAHDEIVGRRASIRLGHDRWTVDGYWPTLWVRDCPSAP